MHILKIILSFLVYLQAFISITYGLLCIYYVSYKKMYKRPLNLRQAYLVFGSFVWFSGFVFMGLNFLGIISYWALLYMGIGFFLMIFVPCSEEKWRKRPIFRGFVFSLCGGGYFLLYYLKFRFNAIM